MLDLMVDAEREFEEFRENLLRECNILFDRFSLMKRLRDAYEDEKERHVLEMSPAFWYHVRSALYQSSILSVTKLLSETEGRLRNFLNFISKNLGMFEEENFKRRTSGTQEFIPVLPETVRLDRKRIDKLLKKVLENFKVRRNGEVAHLDQQYFLMPEKVIEDAPIEWGELDKIMIVVDEVFNRYSRAFDGDVYKLGARDISDINIVLSILREHRERFWQIDAAGQG
ncbi:MAG: hypothetical protein RX317_06580 [bacterium]|nr:hypothetical protein [bacterium]